MEFPFDPQPQVSPQKESARGHAGQQLIYAYMSVRNKTRYSTPAAPVLTVAPREIVSVCSAVEGKHQERYVRFEFVGPAAWTKLLFSRALRTVSVQHTPPSIPPPFCFERLGLLLYGNYRGQQYTSTVFDLLVFVLHLTPYVHYFSILVRVRPAVLLVLAVLYY